MVTFDCFYVLSDFQIKKQEIKEIALDYPYH